MFGRTGFGPDNLPYTYIYIYIPCNPCTMGCVTWDSEPVLGWLLQIDGKKKLVKIHVPNLNHPPEYQHGDFP